MEVKIIKNTFFYVCFSAFFFQLAHAQDVWGTPVFEDMGQDGVKVTNTNGQCVIEIDEEIKNQPSIRINYSGDLGLQKDNDVEGFSSELKKGDDSHYLLTFVNTPDSDGRFVRKELLSVYVDISDKKSCGLSLQNIDDNIPQVTLRADSNCTVEENVIKQIDTCAFDVTDRDGCASSTKFTISAQGVTGDWFSMKFDSISDYPNCLQDSARENSSIAYLSVDSKLDYETAFNYFLTINYKDGNGTDGLSLAQVLLVVDEPDMAPAWKTYASTIRVNEETELSIPFEAIDQDRQINNLICYSLEVVDNGNLSSTEKEYFKIDKNSGLLSIGKIDRDNYQVNSYTLTITAEECVDSSSFVNYTTVVQVQDSINKNITFIIQDASPDNSYPDQIFNENTIPTFDHTVSVSDPDEGDSGTFTAYIDNVNFSVIPSKAFKNGVFTIQGLSQFDYEDEKQRDFVIVLTITEVADNSHKAVIPIHISITNVNDEAPVFTNTDDNQQIFATVTENTASGSLTTISATDLDGDTVKYQIAKYNGLAIDSSTGEITISKDIFDYEQQSEIRIQVTAQDEDAIHTTYAMLVIQVNDIDDEAPTIVVQTVGAVKVNEDAEKDFPLNFNIAGYDKDAEASLEASIDLGNSYGYKSNNQVDITLFQNWFAVAAVPIEGSTDITLNITVTSDLRWEDVDRIQLQLVVTDTKTAQSYQNQATATVYIEIVDVNNNFPVFDAGTCEEIRSVPENSQAGVTIGTISASDADGPGNNKLTYYLQDTTEKRIRISSSNGLITTGDDNIDCEKYQQFTAIIAVKDNDDSHVTTCTITVNVTDLNDNTPTATPDPINIEIYENTTEFEVSVITGQDLDFSVPFHTMKFTLTSFQKYFGLEDFNNGSAKLSVQLSEGSKFDFDEGDKIYQLNVQVTDNPEYPLEAGGQNILNQLVTVSLLDVNDNAPIFDDFSEKTCLFTTKESTQPNITLTEDAKIVATDKDSANNSWISYTIESIECDVSTMNICPPDKEDLFSLSGNTNTMTPDVKAEVKSSKSFTDKFGHYTVTIKAEDHGDDPMWSSRKYLFCIDDVNNNSPVFVNPTATTKSLTIQQNSDGDIVDSLTGKPVSIIATDDDFGNNALVRFTIEPTDIFSIQANGNNQGILSLKVLFADYVETQANITACDKPDEGAPLCSSVKLPITPRFTDNVEPEFENNTWAVQLTENSIDVNVTIPLAFDKNNNGIDDPDNQEKIYYYIIEVEPAGSDDLFRLEKLSGLLSVTKPLDASINDNYTLTVQTSNSESKPPKPNQASLLEISLTVEDINDKYPVFTQTDGYVVSMSLGDQGRDIMTITANDPDRNDHVKYELLFDTIQSHLDVNIADSSKLFAFNQETGVVNVQQYPKEATQGYVSFMVQASDGVHISNTTVTIYVISEQYLMPVQFLNLKTEVTQNLTGVVQKFKEVFRATCIPGQVVYDEDAGYSTLSIHFEDDNQKPLLPNTFDLIKSNVTAMQELRQYLRDEYSLNLIKFGNDVVPIENSDNINIALIAVTAVLAVLLIIAAVFHFFKTRRLNSMVDRLTNASAPKDDKIGFTLPNTNLNAASNPMFEQEVVPDFHRRSSVDSVSSNGSDLIGIEDNPEFETFYNNVILKAESEQNNFNGFDDNMIRENPQLRALDMNDVDLNY